MGKSILVNDSYSRNFWPFYRTLQAFVCGLLFALSGSAQAVPAAPNENWVVGEVVEAVTVDSLTFNIQPQQTLFNCKLRISVLKPLPALTIVCAATKAKRSKLWRGMRLALAMSKVSSSRLASLFKATNAAAGLDLGSVPCHADSSEGNDETTGLLETCAIDRCHGHALDSLPERVMGCAGAHRD